MLVYIYFRNDVKRLCLIDRFDNMERFPCEKCLVQATCVCYGWPETDTAIIKNPCDEIIKLACRLIEKRRTKDSIRYYG